VTLNLISLAAFRKVQIPMVKLQPLPPFSGVGPVSVMPRGFISLPVTFGTAESFRTESVLFDVAEVSLPFNAILGRSALYQFMAVAHYGYLVLRMPSSGSRETMMQGLVRWRSSRLWQRLAKLLQSLGGQDPAPPSSRQCGLVSAPNMQPSAKEDIPVKIVQVGAEADQTIRVSSDLNSK
jgi:hypothetical protein